jgi:hypothetical protein
LENITPSKTLFFGLSSITSVEAPWEHRDAIIKGQKQLVTLNTSLSNLLEREKNDIAEARKRYGQTIVLAEQSKISDVNSTIADNERK